MVILVIIYSTFLVKNIETKKFEHKHNLTAPAIIQIIENYTNN